ncbi:MAG TPA: potassium channel family protein [Acidimicrobiales bacterium]|nr:potassium channel family protein [Acidimicrobiales bacterium]
MGEPGQPTQGQPRSAAEALQLERFDARMRLPLIVSAVLPLIVVPESGNWVGEFVGVATWLVFLVDYVVHSRHIVRWRHTGFGRFDLVVVVLTAPWFLLPGAHAGSFVVVLRLARLARLLMASRGARELLRRLGRVAIVAVSVTVVASLVAYYAEHKTNAEFATIGDALWWGIVTLTTVGYGDIVPKTTTGRWAGVAIMLTGISVLGLLAGSLASFFRLQPEPADDGPDGTDGPAGPSAGAADDGDWRALVAEIAMLRQQIEVLSSRMPPPADEGGAGTAP